MTLFAANPYFPHFINKLFLPVDIETMFGWFSIVYFWRSSINLNALLVNHRIGHQPKKNHRPFEVYIVELLVLFESIISVGFYIYNFCFIIIISVVCSVLAVVCCLMFFAVMYVCICMYVCVIVSWWKCRSQHAKRVGSFYR